MNKDIIQLRFTECLPKHIKSFGIKVVDSILNYAIVLRKIEKIHYWYKIIILTQRMICESY